MSMQAPEERQRWRDNTIRALMTTLSAMEFGATLPYETIDVQHGLDSQHKHRDLLYAARERLARERSGYVFEMIPNVGVYRYTNVEIVTRGFERRNKRARGQYRRGGNELAGVDASALPPEERDRLHLRQALMHIGHRSTLRHVQKSTAEAITSAPKSSLLELSARTEKK